MTDKKEGACILMLIVMVLVGMLQVAGLEAASWVVAIGGGCAIGLWEATT